MLLDGVREETRRDAKRRGDGETGRGCGAYAAVLPDEARPTAYESASSPENDMSSRVETEGLKGG